MRKSNYDKYPHIEVDGFETEGILGYDRILQQVESKYQALGKGKTIIAIDCYPGVLDDELLPPFQKWVEANRSVDSLFINTLTLKQDEAILQEILQRELTDDRVFGWLSIRKLEELMDAHRLKAAQNQVASFDKGIVLIYGVGASLVADPDILIYADMARWEIQQRFRRKEIGNWGADNHEEDILRRYKRGYFIEWRVADRHKQTLFHQIDFLLDTNKKNNPVMITGEAFLAGLDQAVSQPFRVVPFFDPAPWGGQWMKEVCDLNADVENWGWCFDCIPEENSLILKFGKVSVEIPSINVVLKNPIPLLGDRVHARFGAEFPIRFDLLDTVGGGNLSFQVHPLTEYIQQNFGMHYTQDESYYLLDAKEGASVYLGVKTGVNPDEMIAALKVAQKDPDSPFDANKFTNQFPAKKHDHFLIPAGTCHCAGGGAMVLEISATPYIFTFKLWDWGRLGLDGIPRPVHINHGEQVIQFDRDTQWCENQLINQIEPLEKGDGWREERTGLHLREFIETRRHWFTKKCPHHTNGIVNVINLIEGDEVVVESPDALFKPFVVHYAETFIIPASIGKYTITPNGNSSGKECATLKASIRV